MYLSEYFAEAAIELFSNSLVMLEIFIVVPEIFSLFSFVLSGVFMILQSVNLGQLSYS